MNYVINKYNAKTSKWETTESKEKVITGTILVTPSMATAFLENNDQNRPLYQSLINKYSRDMIADNWYLGNDAIAFANNKGVLNGQHRLWAIIESNTSQEFLVVWGSTKEDQEVMDQGRSRQLHDVCILAGIGVGKFASSVGRFIRRQTIQYIPRQATRAEEKDFVINHKKGLNWAEETFKPANIKKQDRAGTVPTIGNDVASAFTRAWLYYQNDPEKRQRVELMAKGLIYQGIYDELNAKRNDGDGAFYNLVCKLNNHRDQGQVGRDERYKLAEKAIMLFVNNECKDLRSSKEELFPLRMEVEAKILMKSKNSENKELMVA